MEQFIASAIVNGNEVQLIKQYDSYFILWGEQNTSKSKQELLTPTGRVPSKNSAYKQFIRAAKAAQYLKFDKL